jgi:ABC-type transport system involved in cytochrome c biogenesis ATPase subunit
MQKLWSDFVRFWIDRVYYNDPKQMVNFIKNDENIFKSQGRQPEYFLGGVLVNCGYIIILFLVSAFLFKKSLAKMNASKQDIADLGKLNIKMKSGDLKIWLTQGHLYRDTLFNVFSGNRKALNKKGITGVVQIDGTDVFSTGSREAFTYLCRPQHIPGDIKVKELITYYAGVQKASKEELKAILDSPEIKPIRRKPFYRLNGSQEFHAMSALLQVKRKQVYLIDDLSTGYPAQCAIRLSEQIAALREAGAIVIFLTSTTDVPSCEKITGAYHDGMYWLYSVESRKASFEMEQQRQKENEIVNHESR